ncbi:S8/S53 family peptidase [Flavobacterium paronense]|uniref:S8 family serine peptidase n=1 Tax=Flavobacterium paronense TaxID=1392775 RepID=A0ABV5GGN9_9FLAO|nr:S8/S53 family peptidase [Flavobacterium paronense]MDN3677142.1 S8/S53 family peptidase [Flavobacterium paronense]
MLKRILPLFLLTLILSLSCSREDSMENQKIVIPENQKIPLTPAQINAKIDAAINSNGTFNWRQADSYLIWSAVVNGNNVVTIGFGNSKTNFERAKTSNNAKLQNDLLAIIMKYENTTLDKILISADTDLNLMDVIISKQETIIALRESKYIRYIEPGDYKYLAVRESLKGPGVSTNSNVGTSSGCGYDSEILDAADYTTTTPNAKIPWTFTQHNIPNAWNISTGSGVTIGIVDTGVSPNQSLLGANFNNGLSSGRTIQKNGVYVDSIWPWSTGTDGVNDLCGHGTSMASTAAAPRNDKGLPVGVAYNANLVTYRAAYNVVLDGYQEQEGVKKAFTALGNNTKVKIISMSMGYVFSVGKIEDAIKFAYGKGKLIFCAAGTSTSFTTFVGVIFPAWMPETLAVTGVKEGSTYQACSDCHTGSKVEFTVAMQRAVSGNTVPVSSYYENLTDYIGGSSVATATTAGIAALVWSKNPTWTRDQVLNKMRQSASLYPNKSAEYGYGNVNAFLAVQ